MTLLKELVCAPLYEGELGLELEVEGTGPLPRLRTKVWGTKGEGSLRMHGNEYYTTGETPIFNDEKKLGYIERLTDKLAAAPVIHNSPRTSLHVHVNVQNMDMVHIYTLACSYWLLENLLTKFCGERLREGNYFCLRLQDAEQTLSLLCNDLKRRRVFSDFVGDLGHELRYSGINFASIPKFGSVEFRSMRGVIDAKIIDLWSSELHNLVMSSTRFTPSQLMDKYFYASKQEFMHLFLSPEFCKMLQSYKHWENLIEENEGAICELAYLEDWDNLKFEKPAVVRRPKFRIRREEEEEPDEDAQDFNLEELLAIREEALNPPGAQPPEPGIPNRQIFVNWRNVNVEGWIPREPQEGEGQ